MIISRLALENIEEERAQKWKMKMRTVAKVQAKNNTAGS